MKWHVLEMCICIFRSGLKCLTRGALQFHSLQASVQALGAIPQRSWTKKTLYSWGYHKHESLNKALVVDLEVLKHQCRQVGRHVSALL